MNVIHALSLTALLASSIATQANILIVDETHCTLIDAITAANTDTAVGGCPAGSGLDIIELIANVTLTRVSDEPDDPSGLPSIIGDLTINGHVHFIARSSANNTPDFRIFHVAPSARLTLNEVKVKNGQSQEYGGGLFNDAGTVFINRSTFINNDAWDSGGAIANFGGMLITNSTLAYNGAIQGGAIYGNGELTMINSTVSNNQADYGAAMFLWGLMAINLTNVTISNNTSNRSYGGLFGDGIFLSLKNTIIANSFNFGAFGSEQGDEVDCTLVGVSATDLGGNLIEHEGSNCNVSAFAEGTNPLLAGLKNNGGPTQTHAPRMGSPVIGVTDCPVATDQRGVVRPQPPGGKCDIGSVELQGKAAK